MALNFTTKNIWTDRADGQHADAKQPGLYQQVRGNSRSWLARWSHDGIAFKKTVGPCKVISLAEARELARDAILIGKGRNPVVIGERGDTFREDAKEYHKREKGDWVPEYADQWWQSMENHVFHALGAKATVKLNANDILAVIEPLWGVLAKASKILDQIRQVIDLAIARDRALFPGQSRFTYGNPAAGLKHILPKGVQPHEKPHGSLPHAEAPTLYARLVAIGPTPAAMGLRFLMLCCAPRATEIVETKWHEIKAGEGGTDFHVPASRLKRKTPEKRAHPEGRIIPLSPQAAALLDQMRQAGGDAGYLFKTKRKGKMIGATGGTKRRPTGGKFVPFAGHMQKDAMLILLQKLLADESGERRIDPLTGTAIDVHGLRSTFRSWVSKFAESEQCIRAAEIALDHVVGGAVERKYDREPLIAERRALATRWAAFLGA